MVSATLCQSGLLLAISLRSTPSSTAENTSGTLYIQPQPKEQRRTTNIAQTCHAYKDVITVLPDCCQFVSMRLIGPLVYEFILQ